MLICVSPVNFATCSQNVVEYVLLYRGYPCSDIQRWLNRPPSYSLLYIGVYKEFTSNTAHVLAQHDVTLISRFKLSYLLI